MGLILFLLSIIGAYLFYGIFAENLGQLIKNKKDTGIPIRVQLKTIFQILLNKKRGKDKSLFLFYLGFFAI